MPQSNTAFTAIECEMRGIHRRSSANGFLGQLAILPFRIAIPWRFVIAHGRRATSLEDAVPFLHLEDTVRRRNYRSTHPVGLDSPTILREVLVDRLIERFGKLSRADVGSAPKGDSGKPPKTGL